MVNQKVFEDIGKSLQDFDKIIDPSGPIGEKLSAERIKVVVDGLIELIVQIVEANSVVKTELTDSYFPTFVDFEGTPTDQIKDSTLLQQKNIVDSLKNMKSNQFKIIAFAHDKDSLPPFIVYLCRGGADTADWIPLGIPSKRLDLINEYGIFSNRFSDKEDFISIETYGPTEEKFYSEQANLFMDWIEKEKFEGLIGFSLDFQFKEPSFIKCLNWETLPETLL